MTSRNALVFKLCPPLLFLMAISIGVVQFDPATNPNVLPIGAPGCLKALSMVLAFILAYGAAFTWLAKPKSLWEWICVTSAAIIPPASTLMLPYSLSQTVVSSPLTFDINVLPLDGSLGFQPSIEMGRIFVHFPWFQALCEFFYDQVLLVLAIVAAGEAYYGRRLGIGAIPTFLLMSSVGFIIYFALPVVGPAPYFGDAFPLITGQLSSTAPRNCMPSLHTAYAIIAFLSTRGGNVWFRTGVGIMSVLVAIATLGLGEHYLVDLILAFPLVAIFRAASSVKVPFKSFERLTAFAVPSLLMLVWGSVVRGTLVPPHVPGFVVMAMAATVGGSLFLESRLASAEENGGIQKTRREECTRDMDLVPNAETAS